MLFGTGGGRVICAGGYLTLITASVASCVAISILELAFSGFYKVLFCNCVAPDRSCLTVSTKRVW